MLLWAWFVDLKLWEAVLETCRLAYSINTYILTRLASSRTSNYRPPWDFAKINALNLVPLAKETRFPKEQSLQFDLA